MARDQERQKQGESADQQPYGVPRAMWLLMLLLLVLTVFAFSKLDPSKPDFSNWAIAVLTALYAILTAVYVIVSTLQWRAVRVQLEMTRRSNADTRRSNALSLRAWLVVQAIDPNKNFTNIQHNAPSGPENWADVVVVNVGKIPATDISVVAYTEIHRHLADVPLPLPSGETRGENLVIGPGHSTTLGIKARPLSGQEIGDIKTGTVGFVLAIKLTYTDAIGSKGVTVINAVYEAKELNWSYIGPGNTVA
jgi:hypothetical protein